GRRAHRADRRVVGHRGRRRGVLAQRGRRRRQERRLGEQLHRACEGQARRHGERGAQPRPHPAPLPVRRHARRLDLADALPARRRQRRRAGRAAGDHPGDRPPGCAVPRSGPGDRRGVDADRGHLHGLRTRRREHLAAARARHRERAQRRRLDGSEGPAAADPELRRLALSACPAGARPHGVHQRRLAQRHQSDGGRQVPDLRDRAARRPGGLAADSAAGARQV
ncbi:MAG: hypothetical protein AVDCRST_MAG67-3311, partial [uncultured Solirubrobacteraceae bacterium]